MERLLKQLLERLLDRLFTAAELQNAIQKVVAGCRADAATGERARGGEATRARQAQARQAWAGRSSGRCGRRGKWQRRAMWRNGTSCVTPQV